MPTPPESIRDVLACVERRLCQSAGADSGERAFNPVRATSNADAIDDHRVRVHVKLSRALRNGGTNGADVLVDLIGHLVLVLAAGDAAEEEATS